MSATDTLTPNLARGIARASVNGKPMPVSRWFRDSDAWLILVPQAYGQHPSGVYGPLACEATEGDHVIVRSKGGREQTVRLGRPRGGYGLGGKLFEAAPQTTETERRAV